jgi:8-oxo-dGTP diphosphatase
VNLIDSPIFILTFQYIKNMIKNKTKLTFCGFCGKKYSDKSIKKFQKEKIFIKCDNCNKTIYNNPKPVVLAIIENNEKEILLTKRAGAPFKEYWGLPGGFLNYGESPQMGIVRELKEELNVSIKIKKIKDTYEELYEIEKDRIISLTVIVFEVALSPKSKIVANDDVIEARFFAKGKLPKKIAFYNLKKFLNKINKDFE